MLLIRAAIVMRLRKSQHRQDLAGQCQPLVLGLLQIVLRIDQGTLGIEQLVFGVQQIQQRALTDLELLLVGDANLGSGEHMFTQEGRLLTQTGHIVPGDRQLLLEVAAGVITHILRRITLGDGLAQACLVGTAAIQVVGQHQLHPRALHIPVGGRVLVTIPSGGSEQFELWHVRALGRLLTGLGRLHQSLLGQQQRAGAQGIAEILGNPGDRQPASHLGCGIQRGRRVLAHHATVALHHIVEVVALGHQIGLRQRQTTAGLLQVHATTHARLLALAQLPQRHLVGAEVFARQLFHFAVTLHIQIRRNDIVGQVFGGRAQIVELGQLLEAQLADIAAGGETIKDQLTQLQIPARAAPVLRWRILDMAAPLAADPALGSDLGTPAPAGHVLAFNRRREILEARLHFGVGHQRLLHHFLQCDALFVGLLRIHGRLSHAGHGPRCHAQGGDHLCNLIEFH